MSSAWVVRAGRFGERQEWAIANGCSGGGWKEMPDLTPYTTKESLAVAVATEYPASAVPNYTGQLWALRQRIVPGDLMVMPLKGVQSIALGRVTSGYRYVSDEADPSKRHVVSVDWQTTDLPKTAVKQDLLFTLGSAMSIFAPSKHHAAARLEHLLKTGTDPGQLPQLHSAASAHSDDVDQPEEQPDVIDIASVAVTARIAEEFAGHGLANLIGELLTAEGFHCIVSPPGSDGGIDIIAGRGVLGIEEPRLVVQVKSGGAVDDPTVNQLKGLVGNEDRGLLVSWGGLTKQARATMRHLRFKVALWEAEQVVDAVQRNYSALSDDTKGRLRLRQIWVAAE